METELIVNQPNVKLAMFSPLKMTIFEQIFGLQFKKLQSHVLIVPNWPY